MNKLTFLHLRFIHEGEHSQCATTS